MSVPNSIRSNRHEINPTPFSGRRTGDRRNDGPVDSSRPGAGTIECLDYGRSFICNTSTANAVRFWVESRTILYDDRREQTGHLSVRVLQERAYVCRGELAAEDNYDFMPIYGGEDMLILRRHADVRDVPTIAQGEGRVGRTEYAAALWHGRHGAQDVRANPRRHGDRYAAGGPDRNVNKETGLRCLMEYPIKTMNISIDNRIWQVDTGPIAFPDLTKRFEPPVDSVRLAFAVFNAPHFCDFVIEQPTPVLRDEQEVCQVYHYSNPISFPAKNRVLSVSGRS